MTDAEPPGDPAPSSSRGRRLDSWGAIAAHLGRSVNTAQRWEKHEGLPVRRLRHARRGSVYAFTDELDDWWTSRSPRLSGAEEDAPPPESLNPPERAQPTPH